MQSQFFEVPKQNSDPDEGSYSLEWSCRGKVCLITGATSGIGMNTAIALARQEARVIIHGRTEEKALAAAETIRSATGVSVQHIAADFSDLDAVSKLASEVQKLDRLDILINNAAVLLSKPIRTSSGIDLTLHVNHLSHFLLTRLCLPQMFRVNCARVVTVASKVYALANMDPENTLGWESPSGWVSYCRSKLANVLFTLELARRLRGTHITVNCLHPGSLRTAIARNYSAPVRIFSNLLSRSVSANKHGPEALITDPMLKKTTGLYFCRGRPKRLRGIANNQSLQTALWNASCSITGMSTPLLPE